MFIIPAMDIRDGQCVRLVHGEDSAEFVYSDDPVEIAKQWEEMGAQMLHILDLDGAFKGTPQNLDVVKAILTKVRIPVQLFGGIRNIHTIEEVLDLGVSRAVLGSAAICCPKLVEKACREFGEQIALNIDGRNEKVVVEGFESETGKTIYQFASDMKNLGIKRLIFNDTRRSGSMRGPNLVGITRLIEDTGLKVIASGGVSSLEDLENLKKLEEKGLEGVIIGKALYSGKIKLIEAQRLAAKKFLV